MNKLPIWTEPKTLEHARVTILEFGKSLHEHAYLIGRELLWVKNEVGHGRFGAWLNENVWFNERTARRFIAFADGCDKAGSLLEYHPGAKTDTVSDLLPDPEHLIRLARAYDMLDEWETKETKEEPLAQEYESLRDEVKELQKIDMDGLDARELKQLIDRLTVTGNRAVELRIRSERELGKILQSEKDGGQGIMAIATLQANHPATVRKLFAERLAELLPQPSTP